MTILVGFIIFISLSVAWGMYSCCVIAGRADDSFDNYLRTHR